MKKHTNRRTLLAGLGATLLTTALSEHVEAARTVDVVTAMRKKHAELISVGSYKRARIVVKNSSRSAVNLKLPLGTLFLPANSRFQGLALLQAEQLAVKPGGESSLIVQTACMQASRSVPPVDYADWKPRHDRAFGQLLAFYHASQLIIGPLLATQGIHSNEQQRNFLQALVWVYFSSSKRHMVAFAAKYIFPKRAQAEAYVNATYPIAKQVIQMYKASAR